MKKFYLLFSIVLVGCATITIFSDNKNCISTRKFKVLQALNDGGSLAYECTLLNDCLYQNQLVYLH